jgi:glycosyl transferase, family 25
MIQTFVINLDRSTDRLGRISKEFARAGLTFNRFPAIDGGSIPPKLQAYFQGCTLLSGEIGCYASHLALWHRVAAGDEPALICEDDVLLPDDLGALMTDLLRVLPNGWDVVRLSSVAKRWFTPLKGRLTGGRYLVQYSREPTKTGAMLVSPAGARKLIEPRSIRRAVDQDLRCPWDFDLRTYGVVPRPIREVPGGGSIIGAKGRRVQRTRGLSNLSARVAHNVRSLGFSNWARCLAWNSIGRKLIGYSPE